MKNTEKLYKFLKIQEKYKITEKQQYEIIKVYLKSLVWRQLYYLPFYENYEEGIAETVLNTWEYITDNMQKDITDCLLKRIYEDVKTVYKNPEYFDELYKKGDREQILIESAWHNVAHMVISKLEIEDKDE